MQNEIPEKVKLVVRNGESQADFARRLFMEAARVAGMPLLEQVSFADYMIKSGEHLFVGKDEKPRLKWLEDPSPKDNNPLVSDKEWKAKHGQWHTHVLGDFNKEELKRRQVYYVLGGGVLGSMLETAAGDTIIVDLNIVYDKNQYTVEKAQQILQPLIDDAIKIYSAIEIKFYITWTAGGGDYTKWEIIGAKDGFVNVLLCKNINKNEKDSTPVTQTYYAETGEIETANIFLIEGHLYGFEQRNLAHELGHRFGIVAHYGVSIRGFDLGNITSDISINKAIVMLRNNLIIKGVDWGRPTNLRPERYTFLPSHKLGPTTYDYLRSGAMRLARKK